MILGYLVDDCTMLGLIQKYQQQEILCSYSFTLVSAQEAYPGLNLYIIEKAHTKPKNICQIFKVVACITQHALGDGAEYIYIFQVLKISMFWVHPLLT